MHRLRIRTALAIAAALAAVPASASASPVMAKLGPTATAADAQAVADRTGLRLETWIAPIDWAVFSSDGSAAAARAALHADPAVQRVDEVVAGETLDTDYTPRDSIWTNTGTVGLNGQAVAAWNWHWVKTNFPAAWDISKAGSNIKVAVIDSEFDTEHPDLKTKLATGKNFEGGTVDYLTGNVRADNVGELHGTHVAGLVAAATDNGFGVSGACFDCLVNPYKVSTSGVVGGAPNVDAAFVADLAQALVAAGDSDAVVINMSLGTRRDHAPVRDAVTYARNKGKIVVASAGNNQLSFPGVPSYPGAYPGVFAVAATQPDDSIAPFSSNGDYVDIAAPGSPILSTWDSRVLEGQQNGPSHGVGYNAISGTSMSSPIVAGLAALVKSVRPELTPDEVESIIAGSAVDLGAAGRDPVFGAGRIDALAALRAAQAYVRPVAPAPQPTVTATPPAATRLFIGCSIEGRAIAPGKRAFYTTRVASPKLRCTGRSAPALRRALLSIQRYSGSAGWREVATVRTSTRGRFGFVRRLRQPGHWTIRVAFPGDAAFQASQSLATRVNVVSAR